jgi:hypothetical protein
VPAPKLDITTEIIAATKALAPAAKRLAKVLGKLDPTTIPEGALADTLYDLRQLTKSLGSVTAQFDDFLSPAIKLVEEHFVQTLAVGEATGIQGKRSRVQVTEAIIPAVEDWEKFYMHIKKTGAFELLNRAVNRTAVQERWDAHKAVPGVGKFHAKKVSCTKLSGK